MAIPGLILCAEIIVPVSERQTFSAVVAMGCAFDSGASWFPIARRIADFREDNGRAGAVRWQVWRPVLPCPVAAWACSRTPAFRSMPTSSRR